ncbi:MAG: kynureninase [Pseudomonadota bacterium]
MNDPNRRDKFLLPDDVIYLDGNSLGPLPAHVPAVVSATVNEAWGTRLIRAWNEDDWIGLSARTGNRIARLIGAPENSVRAGDSTSVNLYKALAAALAIQGNKGVILSDSGNFPTDLYVAQGLVNRLPETRLAIVDPEAVSDAINERVSVVMLTQVDYRTGRKHDMAAITAKAHEVGALVIWDLAHSAGAFAVDLTGVDADFAIGCGYKYLNGGPGAPGFLFVAPRHQNAMPDVAGWFGHAAPFAFETEFRPAAGIDRFSVGTPPILSLQALDAALDVFDDVNLIDLERRSGELTQLFIDEILAFADAYDLRLATPYASDQRGSHVSWHHPNAYPVMQALIAEGVIGDMRAPDYLRFGFAPLYNEADEVRRAVALLHDILATGRWDTPHYRARNKVT